MYVPQQMINQYFILCLFTSRGDIRPNIYMSASASAHCVCVVVCTLGVSLCRCSFVCVRQSIFYVCVTCCDLDVTMRRHYKREREKARGKNNDLSRMVQNKI